MNIRVREIRKVKVSHVCNDCGREIAVGDPCVEEIVYDGSASAIVSEYTCCRLAHQVRTVAPRNAFKPTM